MDPFAVVRSKPLWFTTPKGYLCCAARLRTKAAYDQSTRFTQAVKHLGAKIFALWGQKRIFGTRFVTRSTGARQAPREVLARVSQRPLVKCVTKRAPGRFSKFSGKGRTGSEPARSWPLDDSAAQRYAAGTAAPLASGDLPN